MKITKMRDSSEITAGNFVSPFISDPFLLFDMSSLIQVKTVSSSTLLPAWNIAINTQRFIMLYFIT